MSDIARWAAFDGGIAPHPYGKWILYDDHQAEVERLTAERDAAQAEVERLIAERDEAQAESVRLKTEQDEQKRQKYQVEYECDALVYSARRRAEKATAERDEARAEVERLRANGQGMLDSSRPKGREVGRFGLDGHYLDYEALKPTRPSDEDIWREAFMVLLRKTSYAWERASEEADRVLAEYHKRWPR